MSRLKLVAVASSEETRAKLYMQLQALEFIQFEGVCIELSDAVSKCQASEPHVIVVDMTGRELDAGLFIQAIGMDPEKPSVIFALHRDMDLDIFKDAIRRGAKEFIQYPQDSENLSVALKKHLNLLNKVTNGPAPSPAEGMMVLDASNEPVGQLVSSFASKGGAGSSTVSANLAYELKQLGKRVLFLDLDQFYCNSEVLFASRPEYAISDLTGNKPEDIDAAIIDKITIKNVNGVNIIVGCKNVLDDTEMMSPELLDVVLGHLLRQYDFVIADLPTHTLDPYHQYMVERSDSIVLVSGSDIPSLYRTRQYLDLAQKYLDMDKIKLVLNRYNLKAAYGMTNQELEAKFKFDIFCRIANDWDLNVEANSMGQPIGKINAKSEIAKGYHKLARLLSGEESDPQKSQDVKSVGLLGKLFAAKDHAAHVIQ